MNANLSRILGVEALCAAQGVEFRAPLKTSQPLQQTLARLRAEVETLGEDRYLAPDLETAARLIASGDLAAAAGLPLPTL
jgi:histidine ammonia-lyase